MTKPKSPATFADLLAAASTVDATPVELPVTGLTIHVRPLTKRSQMALAKLDPEAEPEAFQAAMFRAGYVPPNGDGLPSDEDIDALVSVLPAGDFDAVLTAIMEVSGQTPTFRDGDQEGVREGE